VIEGCFGGVLVGAVLWGAVEDNLGGGGSL